MRLVAGLREDHDVAVACPDDGRLAVEVDRAGVERLALPAVDASLRLHPLQTAAGLRQLRAGGSALARVAGGFRADVVHANTPRVGIMGAIGLRRGAPPFVVRAHEHLPLTQVGRAVRSLIVHSASSVAAVSDFTAKRFNEGLTRPVATRVYNSIDQARFDPARVAPAPLREELGLGPDTRLIGQIAQITPWKAQDVSIRALAALRGEGVDAHLRAGGEGRLWRQGRALRQPRVPGLARAARRRAVGAPRRPLPGTARRRAGDHARARADAAALVGGAVRAGDGRGHGARDASARELRRGRPGAGRGRRDRTRHGAEAPRPVGAGRRRAAERPRPPAADGRAQPAGRGPVPRRRARRGDGRALRERRRACVRATRSPCAGHVGAARG